MSEETKNLIVLGLLAVVGFMGWRFWMKKRNPTASANGVSVSDIYINGGIPAGVSMNIPNPDGGSDQDATEGYSNLFPFFDYVQGVTIGAF